MVLAQVHPRGSPQHRSADAREEGPQRILLLLIQRFVDGCKTRGIAEIYGWICVGFPEREGAREVPVGHQQRGC